MNNEFVQRAIELCLAVYRITDKFPQEEPLRNGLRAICLDVMDFLVHNVPYPASDGGIFHLEDLKKKLRNLFTQYEIAEEQEWVHRKNFEVLRYEYRKLYQDITLCVGGEKDKAQTEERKRQRMKRSVFNERQSSILSHLANSKKGLSMEELAEAMHSSKRTVARNVKTLLRSGSVVRRGNTRSTTFVLAENY